ncbi:hypothetical protein PE066_08725 [Ramlibacter tataouinensis]|uniref:hypothetical protein n=1 Tax=Ramlibacter tataouinensis TaxID=94132 RepID=UPI0022F39EAA|nr:hypothetical protein [Ramlibacter tataouinensis]WBY03598.1 hypothetical protein PE066_08725 [Ramlibacter tataouinensis]
MKEPSLPAGSLESIRSSSGLLDLSRQQRNILLFRPIFQLERSKALVQEADGSSVFDGIDTHYLALSALDHMMEATTISMGSTSTEVLQHLAETATRMRSSLELSQAQRIATTVLDVLDNKANKHREFEAEYFDAPTGRMRTFRFRLVQFQPDPQDVYRYTPTAEGYLVYLGMLDLSPEDSQELMEKMLDLLVRRGRFEAALDIARRARKLSIEFRQLISDKLQQAYRAPSSVNWSKEMHGRLEEARNHVTQRQAEDFRMEQAVGDALHEATELRTRENLVQLRETLRGASDIRMKLVRDISASNELFITAQKAAFRARRPMGLPDLESAIFPNVMQLQVPVLLQEADDFLSALYPPQPLKLFDLNTAFTILRETRTDDTPAAEEEGELEEFVPVPDPFPKALVDETRNWLAGKFEGAPAWQVDYLLELARDEGLSAAAQRCLVFILYQSFAQSENTFEGMVARKVGEEFVLDFVRGDNIEFFRKEGQ